MIIVKELHGAIEALAIGFYCRGTGQELRGDEYSIAQQAIAGDLERPWEHFQALITGFIATSIMVEVNEINARGLGNVQAGDFRDMAERLPLVILNETEIDVEDDEDEA